MWLARGQRFARWLGALRAARGGSASTRRDDFRTALMGVREVVRCVELLGRFKGELTPTVNLGISVAIDAQTAARLAETYLRRHGRSSTVAQLTAGVIEGPTNEAEKTSRP